MLVEIQKLGVPSTSPKFNPADPATYGHCMVIYTPPNTARYPECCYHIAAADWRYLLRFLPPGRPTAAPPPARQLFYTVPAALHSVLAGAEPYLEDSGAA